MKSARPLSRPTHAPRRSAFPEAIGASSPETPEFSSVAEGTIFVRLVTRHQVQFALLRPEAVQEVAGLSVSLPVVGHAKVHLLAWQDRDPAWLERRLA